MGKVTMKIEETVHARFRLWAAVHKNYSMALEKLLNIAENKNKKS